MESKSLSHVTDNELHSPFCGGWKVYEMQDFQSSGTIEPNKFIRSLGGGPKVLLFTSLWRKPEHSEKNIQSSNCPMATLTCTCLTKHLYSELFGLNLTLK